MNIGSKESALIIQLLNEFVDGPNDLGSLVQAFREKGYCKSLATAYRYANRVLAIRKIFTTRNRLKWAGRGGYIIARINNIMDNSLYNVTEKQQLVETEIQDLRKILMTCAQYDLKAPSMS